MASNRIPSSERLQNRLMKDKFPESKGKDGATFLVYFPGEIKYSIVTGKNVISPPAPTLHGDVTVRDSSGKTYKGKVAHIGDRDDCQKKQVALEKVLQLNLADDEPACEPEDKDAEVPSDDNGPSNGAKNASSRKRKGKKRAIDSSDDEDDLFTKNDREISQEVNKVKTLLQKYPAESKGRSTSVEGWDMEPITTRLDEIKGLLEQLIRAVGNQQQSIQRPQPTQPVNLSSVAPQLMSPVPSKKHARAAVSQSPETCSWTQRAPTPTDESSDTGEEFIYNGINLLQDVQAKSKKQNLYATALLSTLFTEDEMRNGCVEPKEGSGTKPALDQGKINLIKRCVAIKYGDKALDKCWNEIRVSLNQKCLDKLKVWRRRQQIQQIQDQDSSEIQQIQELE